MRHTSHEDNKDRRNVEVSKPAGPHTLSNVRGETSGHTPQDLAVPPWQVWFCGKP